MRGSYGATPAAWPPQVPPPTLSERRNMKKAAQPEHAYTGYIPKWMHDPDDPAAVESQPRKRNPPILGYSGHLRHEEDRIGTTFTRGLEVAGQPAVAPAGPLTATNARHSNNQTHVEDTKKRVTFQDNRPPKASEVRATRPTEQMSNRSGYGAFDGASGYGEFKSKPLSSRSGYGAFDGASGYGEFAARPSQASGYGAFDGASGYGEFAAKPSEASGYGAFDGASGYGEFAAKPMSARSGYGAFDNASGYGEFLSKPMSARSGYGEFAGGSGYGEFAAPPSKPKRSIGSGSGYGDFDAGSGYGDFLGAPGRRMSPRSGYGEFDGASGYGEFLARPQDEDESPRSNDSQEYGAFGGDASIQYGDFMSARSGYGAFDNASGYGEFMARPPTPPPARPMTQPQQLKQRPSVIVKLNEDLDRQYQRALKAVGGESNVNRLLDAFAKTIAQRYHKRTELLQALKRNFEKHEQQDQGKMPKPHLKEALLGLSCVFTDDQIMALMAIYDPECRGYVSMDAILTELSTRALS